MKRGLFANLAPVVFAISLVGCVSGASGSDLRRVREIAPSFEEKAKPEEPSFVSADEAKKILREPLSMDAAVRVAVLNNRNLAATIAEMGIARGHLITASSLPNPTFEVELLPERDSEYELRVEYELTHALLAPYRARSAEFSLESARYRAASEALSLGLEVRAAYYELEAALERLSLTRTMIETFAAESDAATALANSGNTPELLRAEREAAFERAKLLGADLEVEVFSAREHLSRLLGTAGEETSWEIAETLPELPKDIRILPDLEKRSVEANLELRARKEALEGLARKAGYLRLEGLLPEIAVDVHALRAKTEDPNAGENGREFRFGGGLSAEVPLFDQKRGQVRVAVAEFDAEIERYVGAAVELRSFAREVGFRLQVAHRRAMHYEKILLPAHEHITQETLLQNNAMQASLFRLLDARRQELVTRLEATLARKEFFVSEASYAALLEGATIRPRELRMNPISSRKASEGAH